MGDLISVSELAAAWGLSVQRIRVVAERVPGAQKVGRAWVFPASSAAIEVRDALINPAFRRREGFMGLPISGDWVAVPGCEQIAHPLRGDMGALVYNERTRMYALHCGISYMSVPQGWAREQATGNDASKKRETL